MPSPALVSKSRVEMPADGDPAVAAVVTSDRCGLRYVGDVAKRAGAR
jgi:hypothetical protein